LLVIDRHTVAPVTMEEIGEKEGVKHCRVAIAGVIISRAASNVPDYGPERTVMTYAWNELGEGGYIVPTKGDRNDQYLDALLSVLKPVMPATPGH
jgi:hypothetical protein